MWQKSSRYGAMAGITQKGCVTLFPLRYFKKKQKTVVGYIDIKQQETYEKLKNRGWYSKWYWHFSNAATTNDNNNDDNSLASTVLLLLTTNESNNCNNYNNNNVLIIKIIITIKMKSGYALKWKKD